MIKLNLNRIFEEYMNKELLLKYLKTYHDRHDSIMEQYGVKDGFLIDGKYWWDAYKELIKEILTKIDNKTVAIEDFHNFYRKFGFGPKLYANSVLEYGVEKLSNLFKFLSNASIEPNIKLKETQKNPEKYKDLLIRVAGYSAFFVELDKRIQDDIINRTEHEFV